MKTKKHILYVTVRLEVESCLSTLSDTIAEFELHTEYSFGSTEHVAVVDTELLETETFNP